VASMPHCGTCGNCLDGRGSSCTQFLPQIPAATMSDRTPVYMTSPGYAEYLVAGEERVIPIFTRVPPVELSLFACTALTGLGLAMCRVSVEAGTDVAVFGLGPLGASAVQGARIQGARAIIGVDPIRYRRELALKIGATHVFDPNVDKGDDLISKIRAISADPVPAGRRYTGERAAGPMYSLEAAGWTRFPLPSGIEAPSDLTGVEALQQTYAAARSGGYVRTAGVFEAPGATITFPAGVWGAGGKTHFGGNFAGSQPLRDIPRFIRLVERGAFDAKSLVGKVYKPGEMKDALRASADRSAISAVIDFT
jgi:Zn-dependent alcohol dehydrogenase